MWVLSIVCVELKHKEIPKFEQLTLSTGFSIFLQFEIFGWCTGAMEILSAIFITLMFATSIVLLVTWMY